MGIKKKNFKETKDETRKLRDIITNLLLKSHWNRRDETCVKLFSGSADSSLFKLFNPAIGLTTLDWGGGANFNILVSKILIRKKIGRKL